jgi:hypothetical protein
MAHFAKIKTSDNVVVHVSGVDNWNITNGAGDEVESIGIAYLEQVHGVDANHIWRQTSYNGNMRKNYAGIGMTWDEGRDAFIPPKPYNSWVLNETTCHWDPPTAMPTDANMEAGEYYRWDEPTTSWVKETRT